MAADVDAVIAALRVALDEAQKSSATCWKISTANRWINQLPGAGLGRWRQLKLSRIGRGEISRTEYIGHVRAVLAYLDANREAVSRPRTWWPAQRRATPTHSANPAPAAPVRTPAKPINLLRVRKPMPGVH